MKEEALHFIWKNRLFGLKPLKTTDDQLIEVISPGIHNTDSGPDFFNAKIKIGDTLWAGNIEIHIKTSDWLIHNHQNDKNYSNIILHVVFENDVSNEIKITSAPTLVLPISERFKSEIENISNKNEPFCYSKLHKITNTEISNYLEYLLIERLEEKYITNLRILEESINCWNTLFYKTLIKYFGGYTNNHAFEQLSNRIPHKILLQNSSDLLKNEALLFGTAGFLEKTYDNEYYVQLQNEYAFQKAKYGLTPLPIHIWKFLRLRPSNFPTIRIAQLAHLICKNAQITNSLFNLQKLENLELFDHINTNTYWNNHYQFSQTSKPLQIKTLGKTMQNQLIINVVIPYIYTYHKKQNNYQMCERVIDWLYNMKPEKNSTITNWEKNGIESTNSATSQALYHLKSRYCDRKDCIRCRIGQKTLAEISVI